jgi:hypothetical protein
VYIQNVHTVPITAKARSAHGKVLFSKTFFPVIFNRWSNKMSSTGYTALTEEEYTALRESSRTFNHYANDLGLLVVCDDLPPEAKTPHEALVDARKEGRKLNAEIEALKAENETLKAALFDAEKRYKVLQSASSEDEKLKPLNDKIAALAAENERLKAAAEAQKRSGKNGKSGKDFE